MNAATPELIHELLTLPAFERATIADELLASLDKPDPEIDALWVKEAERRLRAYDAGEVRSLSDDEFFAEDDEP
jgi:putative addiction module component (TIGR02574 family)